MGEFFGGTAAALFILYFALCGVFVPITVYRSWSAERECARAHGVYACESHITWEPIGETK